MLETAEFGADNRTLIQDLQIERVDEVKISSLDDYPGYAVEQLD